MHKKLIHWACLERLDTWVKYRSSMCRDCMGSCCNLPVEVRLADLVRLELVDAFEAEHTPAKQIAKRLEKAGVIEHFNFRNSIFTLSRLSNGDCHYLDQTTRLCTVYEKRPATCRNHPQIGPRPGYCAYRNQP